jgi:DNA-3-methyladenine glycosylase II
MTKINESALSHLRKDKILRKIIDQTGLPVREKKSNIYHSLLGSIISQQLSTKAAATIHARFLTLFDGKPHPEMILETEHEVFRSVGLSNQKAVYVKNVADFFLNNPIENKHWNKLDDDTIIKELTSIKGVGKWTVQMTLMFTLDRPDVLPVDDLIIRNSIVRYYGLDPNSKALIEDVYRVGEKWKPYRSIACFYLWAAKDGLK